MTYSYCLLLNVIKYTFYFLFRIHYFVKSTVLSLVKVYSVKRDCGCQNKINIAKISYQIVLFFDQKVNFSHLVRYMIVYMIRG